MITEIFKYYGLDWLSMIFSLIAMILLSSKIKWGFVSFMFANFTWILLGLFLLNSYAIVLGNIVFLITNTRGFIKWNSQPSKI